MISTWVSAIVAVAFLSAAEIQADRVNVTIHYESLCQYSQQFILQQLVPAWHQLSSKHLALDFVPSGFTNCYPSGMEDGPPYFCKCQNLEDECHGNTVQACADHLYGQDRDGVVQFIACAMASLQADQMLTDEATRQCANKVGMDSKRLLDCAKGDEGAYLNIALWKRAVSVKPAMTHVPWILFNGVFTWPDEMSAINNLTQVVCKKLGTDKPRVCEQF